MSTTIVPTVEPTGLAQKEPQDIVTTNIQTPAHLLELAISNNLDIEKLERLMDMQERWEANQSKKSFYDSIALFQANCPPILKTGKAHNSKFAPLSEISKTIRDTLHDCGLSYRWEQEEDKDFIKITCIVTHRFGHSERTHLSAQPDDSGKKNAIQSRGSTLTYLQRYTLISALGLTTADIDDDGGKPVETIDENQLANLEALIGEVDASRTRFLKFLNINQLQDLAGSDYQGAIQALESKRK